MSARVLQLTAI